ncbi:SURF1 family protein [Nocardioides marmorisolisilvae]|uniref:SURF1-like protein n=1 Tax=Nocardioides marmorisolisilvae TaxID=1542737 RepID=A0A3N0DUV1_9ACTN|nr:SURF1 family protein [Nocardioides marmorisolisilvae]RNL79404.1 SURF1 family protein [Nocardioides marmorisolisilvae]
MRFLFSRRWVLFALTVGLMAWGATLLGQWQFHRLDERKSENSLLKRNLDQPPVPLTDLLTVGKAPSSDDEWRKVIVHGTWDDAHTIVLKYQTRDGGPGVDIVTPLVTADGPAVLVDRGWMKTENSGAERPKLPAVTPGDVTVIGWIRKDGSGRASQVNDLATRAISSQTAAKVVPYPLFGGFLDVETESPSPATALGATELPDDTSEGPHFFYGLQWWFFGFLAVFGFGYLAYDEWRRAQEDSERAQHATVDGEHDPGDEG